MLRPGERQRSLEKGGWERVTRDRACFTATREMNCPGLGGATRFKVKRPFSSVFRSLKLCILSCLLRRELGLSLPLSCCLSLCSCEPMQLQTSSIKRGCSKMETSVESCQPSDPNVVLLLIAVKREGRWLLRYLPILSGVWMSSGSYLSWFVTGFIRAPWA